MTLEFLSYEILANFMRNEFRISRKKILVLRNFVFREIGFSMRKSVSYVSYFAKQKIQQAKRNETPTSNEKTSVAEPQPDSVGVA